MNNVELVKQCYRSFQRGDIASLLALFDPGIEFRLAEGHPYNMDGKPWVGGPEITEHFFRKAGTEWQNWDIIVLEILETPGAVVVECRYTGVYKPTGRALDIQVCHIWKLTGSRVVSFHQYIDTARLQAVMGWDLLAQPGAAECVR
jgi:ketosteroid isomerase-like protein